MDVNPQYIFDKDGNPEGVTISIEEWVEVSNEIYIEPSQWQKDALDAEQEAISLHSGYLQQWDDVKKKLLS